MCAVRQYKDALSAIRLVHSDYLRREVVDRCGNLLAKRSVDIEAQDCLIAMASAVSGDSVSCALLAAHLARAGLEKAAINVLSHALRPEQYAIPLLSG